MSVELTELEERFRAYVDGFLGNGEESDYHIDLKLRHSLRVYELAREIAERDNLPALVTRLGLMAALFHDTGRFPQYAQFQSFHDPSTANHARLGVTALLHSDLLHDLTLAERRTVLGAVFLHNVRDLPCPLHEPLASVVRLVRDCDKLDIIPIMLDHLDPNQPHNKVVTLGVAPDPSRYTLAILDAVRERRMASYQDMRWYHDFRLLTLGWFYDLNYPGATTIFAERGYAGRIFSELPVDSATTCLRAQMEMDMAHKAQKRS
ncbi:MAG: HD domain-containing protein [Desulfovibrionaceae bacterium]